MGEDNKSSHQKFKDQEPETAITTGQPTTGSHRLTAATF
jgi:hypothetical protein